MEKTCRICNLTKLEEEFIKGYLYCKKCKSKRQYDKIRNNPELRRHYKFKWRYGIGLDDYNKMFTDQEGKCLVCERHQEQLDKRLRVDHNHETGEVRGLLCDNCNTALGLLKEDVNNMTKLISYINGEL